MVMAKVITMLAALSIFIFYLPLILMLHYLEEYSVLTIESIVNIYAGLSSSMLGMMLLIFPNDEFRRPIKYSSGINKTLAKYVPILMVFCGILYTTYFSALYFVQTSGSLQIKKETIFYLLLQLCLCLMYVALTNRMVRRILLWRAPDLALIRALVDAFETVAEGRPASWRSIHMRRRAAQYIARAAETLEGPIARGFAASAGFDGAGAIQDRFLMAGAALRRKIAWLATPMAETREHLGRTLAGQLLIAAAGDLDRLEYAALRDVGESSGGWLSRFRAAVSWAAFAFGPAIFLILSKWSGWITDPTTTGIFIQFAALCFLTAVLSAADPTGYKDRLSSVAGTGTALFGWKKLEKSG
jgi:hypothetical protein